MELRADDAFWAARRVAAFTDDMIRAAVHTGEFSNPAAEKYLADVLIQRRETIKRIYLTGVNPIVNPRLDAKGLTFGNAAVDGGVASGAVTYRASWMTFDNMTGATKPLSETNSATTTIAAPGGLPSSGFVAVDIAADSAGLPDVEAAGSRVLPPGRRQLEAGRVRADGGQARNRGGRAESVALANRSSIRSRPRSPRFPACRALHGRASCRSISSIPAGSRSRSAVSRRWKRASGRRPSIRWSARRTSPTLDLPILAGRAFDRRDTRDGLPVCIVNEALARRFRGRSPIGQRVALRPISSPEAEPVMREIVGVARQVKGRPDETEAFVQIYVPMAQDLSDDMFLVVRPTSGRAEALTSVGPRGHFARGQGAAGQRPGRHDARRHRSVQPPAAIVFGR